ncbi:MmgE/PrpD family protein [Pseudomonas sp. CAN2814]|uniref:MmgE/PrpD family protein n=1 Tax=Pseudomonas sp. CAN1 TaxID=3046726 RepID=UPI002648FAA5|nr:MmgE/PrpD family protein [Pseudomonas sp. CAN1]MDN6860235.1 MmgE/PrpD family protein [Pseudomonas sp. CAN1]
MSLHTAPTSPTDSERIADFALHLDLDAVPAAVQTLAKEHLLDVLGIALASSSFDFGRAAIRGVRALGNGDQASLLGSSERLPATSAALANGILAHCLDFDDTHIGAIYHASAPAMAAALAAGQASGASGREVLTAFIIALEIGCRLGSAAAGQLHGRGFHPTALCGTFAAAAAAGYLNRLDHAQMVSALGLCGSMAAGILEVGESWLKRLHPGWAAHGGLSAVALAQAGFLGPNTVLEGARGFYATHVQTVPSGERSPAHALGEQWQSLGIALKPYPCCHFLHGFVDAALSLRGQFELDDIERIECPLTAMLHPLVGAPRERCVRPPTVYAALFSVHYVVALALLKGRVDLGNFYDEPLNDPQVLALADKVHVLDDPASDFPRHFPGEVRVHLKDGRVIQCRQPTSLGTPERPLTRAQIEEKFFANASRAISREAAKQLAEQVLNLDRVSSLEPLLALCRA